MNEKQKIVIQFHYKNFFIHNICRYVLNLYKHLFLCCFSVFCPFNEGILNIPGIKLMNIGYTNDNPKLINVSSIK